MGARAEPINRVVHRWHRGVALTIVVALLAACGSRSNVDRILAEGAQRPLPTTEAVASDTTTVPTPEPDVADSAAALEVPITVEPGGRIISELIRGISGDADEEYVRDAGITLNSWGGNPATRYNYELGHAWNAGADWSFRNGNYDTTGDVAAQFLSFVSSTATSARLAVPTLGWVAKNDDNTTCSFPSEDGTCEDVQGLDCANPTMIADPTTANVESSPEDVRAWIARLLGEDFDIDYIAMDNEPELWGVTHYDVHPTCPTYEEILDTYLRYATALRDVAPDSKLTGPVMCCWYDFWGIAPGPAEGPHEDFLPWFLRQVHEHDATAGERHLDVVDVHYYPQSDVYNDAVDEETAARRLRSTRSLWDPEYVDESWIDQPIALVPRLLKTIESAYPSTPLAITEWNFGADASMNGALAIADVLGIYGREGVHAAAYWRSPPIGSPGYFAFKMHGNYDGAGASFGGIALPVVVPNWDRLSAYATLDEDRGRLQVMLINKQPDEDLSLRLQIDGATIARQATMYRYSMASPDAIVAERTVGAGAMDLVLPPYSISLLELQAGTS